MSVTYLNAAVSDRLEFQRARKEAGMSGHEVAIKAGYNLNACYLFETGKGPLSDKDEQKLLDFLQAIVTYECATPDYRAAILAYKAKHGVSRNEMCRRCDVKEFVLRKLERGDLKTRMRPATLKKLDALLFAD